MRRPKTQSQKLHTNKSLYLNYLVKPPAGSAKPA
ncbi:hypothetical protein SBA3_1550007 [Candidatus Sulfopaludibacter sp. SbA3]|nr:hypothetical protein SBA3_1550007 [Candidatus Sulfopaludibacter sp. SbA3]